MPEVTIRDGESVEAKSDLLLEEFWAREPAPVKKRGRKPKPIPEAIPQDGQEGTPEAPGDTRSPEQVQEDVAALATILTPVVTTLGQRVAAHYHRRDYTPDEGAALAQAGAAVVDKYLPDMGGYAPEAQLAFVLGGQILTRLQPEPESE